MRKKRQAKTEDGKTGGKPRRTRRRATPTKAPDRRKDSLYQAVFDALDEAVHLADRDLRIVLVNRHFRRWLERLGIRKTITGKTVQEAFPFLPSSIPRDYRKVFRTGETLTTEEQVSIGGRTLHSAVHKVPIKGEGKVSHVLTIVEDITQRKAAERALRESEERYRLLAETAPDFIYVIGRDMRLQYVNPAGARLLGFDAKDLVGQPLERFFPPETYRRQARNLRRVLKTGHLVEVEQEYHLPGRSVWMDARLAPMRDRSREIVAVLGISRNLTAQHEAIEALRGSESRHRMLTDESDDGIVITESSGRILEANPRACEMLGYSRGCLEGADGTEFLSEEDGTPLRLRMRDVLTGNVITTVRRAHRADGSLLTVETRSKLLPNGQILTIIRDISEQRRLEREMREITSREQEVLGRALHDSLGQELAGIGFLSAALAKQLAARSLPEAQEASQIAELAKRAILQTRRIAHGLGPIDLSKTDLPDALRRLAEATTELFGIPCRTTVRAPVPVRDMSVATHLYHVAQESLSNAVRHADAGTVTVRLSVGAGKGSLVVEDDGKGIPKRLDLGRSLGMRTMRYRAEMIDGSLSFQRRAKGGTKVVCTFRNRQPPRTP